MMHFEYAAIGRIRSPFPKTSDMPIQPCGARGTKGAIECNPALIDGLQDLDGFSHLILMYHFHAAKGFDLKVVPFLDAVPRGVFATRAPRRPNPIGLSVVRLAGIEESTLYILDVDVLDKTPLLDIKPYVPAFDTPEHPVRTGWLEAKGEDATQVRSDDRFQ